MSTRKERWEKAREIETAMGQSERDETVAIEEKRCKGDRGREKVRVPL